MARTIKKWLQCPPCPVPRCEILDLMTRAADLPALGPVRVHLDTDLGPLEIARPGPALAGAWLSGVEAARR
jgi:hypothetical protein